MVFGYSENHFLFWLLINFIVSEICLSLCNCDK
jgi:hypothetical protein